jgi:hypothetical protein
MRWREEFHAMKIGRNEPCPCGSGRKYKHCCLDKKQSTPVYQKFLIALVILIMAGGLVQMLVSFRALEPGASPGKVWSEEHQHWH